jgi:hypothetical protein
LWLRRSGAPVLECLPLLEPSQLEGDDPFAMARGFNLTL